MRQQERWLVIGAAFVYWWMRRKAAAVAPPERAMDQIAALSALNVPAGNQGGGSMPATGIPSSTVPTMRETYPGSGVYIPVYQG